MQTIPVMMVLARFFLAALVLVMLVKDRDSWNRKYRFTIWVAISVCILLDLTDAHVARWLGLTWIMGPVDGIADGCYIVAGFLSLYSYRVEIGFKRGKPTEVSAIDGSVLRWLGIVWIFLAALAYVGSFRKPGIAFLHMYYVGAGVWLWYSLGKLGLPARFSRYLPAIFIILASMVVFLDHSRFIDFLNGRP